VSDESQDKFIRNASDAVDRWVDNELEPDRQAAFGGKPGEPVPEVDPDDIKAVRREYQDMQKRHPGDCVAITMRVLGTVCRPGADMQAVCYRQTQLSMIEILADKLKVIPAETMAALRTNGDFNDAAFRAMAKVPMQWAEVGVVRAGLPFDFDEFLRLCAA
jgi:hypothetical protein